ncbi:hypothetical protein D3C85_1011590 [compost metagenome]
MDQHNHIPSCLPGIRLIDAEDQRFSFPLHFHLEYHLGLAWFSLLRIAPAIDLACGLVLLLVALGLVGRLLAPGFWQ